MRRLQALFKDSGCGAKLRTRGENGEPSMTNNKNYIMDFYFNKDIGDLKAASDEILRLTGVVKHDMFLDMATTVIVAEEFGVTNGVAGGCGGGWENLREMLHKFNCTRQLHESFVV